MMGTQIGRASNYDKGAAEHNGPAGAQLAPSDDLPEYNHFQINAVCPQAAAPALSDNALSSGNGGDQVSAGPSKKSRTSQAESRDASLGPQGGVIKAPKEEPGSVTIHIPFLEYTDAQGVVWEINTRGHIHVPCTSKATATRMRTFLLFRYLSCEACADGTWAARGWKTVMENPGYIKLIDELRLQQNQEAVVARLEAMIDFYVGWQKYVQAAYKANGSKPITDVASRSPEALAFLNQEVAWCRGQGSGGFSNCQVVGDVKAWIADTFARSIDKKIAKGFAAVKPKAPVAPTPTQLPSGSYKPQELPHQQQQQQAQQQAMQRQAMLRQAMLIEQQQAMQQQAMLIQQQLLQQQQAMQQQAMQQQAMQQQAMQRQAMLDQQQLLQQAMPTHQQQQGQVMLIQQLTHQQQQGQQQALPYQENSEESVAAFLGSLGDIPDFADGPDGYVADEDLLKALGL